MQGVRPCGENRDQRIVVIADAEINLRSDGTTDPVGLHRAHPLGPSLQQVKIVEQCVGVVGNAQEPLPEIFLLNQGPGSPGATFTVNLLIGQHGLVDRIPVDRGVFLVRQSLVHELQKEPLGPAVIVRMTGGLLP